MRIIFSFLSLFFLLIASVKTFAVGALVFDPSVFARLGSEAVQLENQLNVLKQQLAAIKQLNPKQYQWSNVQNLINQLGSSIEEAKGISYSAKNVSKKFKDTFPGFVSNQKFDEQYQNVTNNTLNTLNGVLSALNKSSNNFQNENARLSFLQSQEKSAVGQTQAIQAAAQIASEQVSQLQLLRQAIMAETTAQSAYYANQVQVDASSKAEFKKVLLSGKINSQPIGHSGNEINLSPIKLEH